MIGKRPEHSHLQKTRSVTSCRRSVISRRGHVRAHSSSRRDSALEESPGVAPAYELAQGPPRVDLSVRTDVPVVSSSVDMAPVYDSALQESPGVELSTRTDVSVASSSSGAAPSDELALASPGVGLSARTNVPVDISSVGVAPADELAHEAPQGVGLSARTSVQADDSSPTVIDLTGAPAISQVIDLTGAPAISHICRICLESENKCIQHPCCAGSSHISCLFKVVQSYSSGGNIPCPFCRVDWRTWKDWLIFITMNPGEDTYIRPGKYAFLPTLKMCFEVEARINNSLVSNNNTKKQHRRALMRRINILTSRAAMSGN